VTKLIKHVKEWDQRSPHGFPTPVIAYTGTGPATLKKCLERRGNLYDIWDKLSAGADYVAWRFQRLAAELPRYRPDATIQKLIAAMPAASSPEWHRQVLRLVKNYGAGQTEHEQVRQCRDSLQTMLDAVCTTQAVALMALWDRLVKSEPLLRAASPKLRGIARHSINVFWFGYWLINHPLLETNMRCLWTEMSGRRFDGHLLNSVDPLVGMNSVWLLASLFHDAGKFHENNKAITDVSLECSKEFASLSLGTASWAPCILNSLPKPLDDVLLALKQKTDDPLVSRLEAHIKGTWVEETPDHGAVAAGHLVNIFRGGTPILMAYAREAARAVLLHSCLPGVFDAIKKEEHASTPQIEWQRDPVASLLLFCDQIQTWDRHDPAKDKQDYPDRAELSFLELTASADRPSLKGCINYIAPSRVDMYPELRRDITESLNKVVLEKPKDTLLHVLEPGMWPLCVHLDCALSGEPLAIDMDFA
jgi:hypothetical protein